MKKTLLSLICLLLALTMLAGMLAACTDPVVDGTEEETKTEQPSGTEPPQPGSDATETSSKETSGKETSDTEGTESESSSETETEPVVGPMEGGLEGNYAATIAYANALANGVQARFTDDGKRYFSFQNQKMFLEYAMHMSEANQVTKLTNKSGVPYVENTMDVFVKMQDGKTYYASNSTVSATANMYRVGYYYNEVRLEEQVFTPDRSQLRGTVIDHMNPKSFNHSKGFTKGIEEENVMGVLVNAQATDSFINFGHDTLSIPVEDAAILELTLKLEPEMGDDHQIWVVAGDETSFGKQSIRFNSVNDGEWHVYEIPLSSIPGYTGTLKGLRLDINNVDVVTRYYVKSIRVLPKSSQDGPSALSLNRSFHVYSDKLHQTIQVVSGDLSGSYGTVNDSTVTKGIECIGMVTAIPADKVAKLLVKDAAGTHEVLEGVDWESVEYVGFDIKDAGIFGYILPYDGRGGKLEVTLADGVYSIIQTHVPKDNEIKPSSEGMANANDFYMGQRIYTDETHDFAAFLNEAYLERNPLKDDFFKVDTAYSSLGGSYAGYDSLRGSYKFTIGAPTGGFPTPYFKEPNRHYRLNFSINGDAYDRQIYVLAYAAQGGNLECAALLDKHDVMLPVPLEVGKNFCEKNAGNGEWNKFNVDDFSYGETIFPLSVGAKSRTEEYTLLNLYQRWGNYPLKQISFIQYSVPYLHLSTGVVESNCILPWFGTKGFNRGANTLPDHRAMSAPFWNDGKEPQHDSCGNHYWLLYTADGDKNMSMETGVHNEIKSSGPTYAEIDMIKYSDGDKIKATYTHLEMPQTDENRTYYTMKFEVLEDISFADFSRDFQFYSVEPNDPTGIYQKLGYLDESNESVVINTLSGGTAKYVLGDDHPYYTLFDMKDYSSTASQNGYANVAFMVYSSEFVIGGEKCTPSFAVIANKHGEINRYGITLDLGEITLKKGDVMTINAILLPWGSQESVYDSPDHAPDQNVRNVRLDSILNPITGTAGENCVVVHENVFMPCFRSTNGVSAEFTVSGGYKTPENHVVTDGQHLITTRVYGFGKMTVPVIYEKIDGEWVRYEVSSINAPDQNNDAHYYDGYCIHYDADTDSFSYSFVFDMSDGEARTFKLVADGSYEAWKREPNKVTERENLLNVYTDHQEIGTKDGVQSLINAGMIGNGEISEDDTYVRLYGAGDATKYNYSSLHAYNASVEIDAGRYLAVKYRFSEQNSAFVDHFTIYTSTYGTSAAADNTEKLDWVFNDGEWHLLIVDLTKLSSESFAQGYQPDANGKYIARFLRFDFFNKKLSTDSYIDIEFIGFDPDFDKILALATQGNQVEKVEFMDGKLRVLVDPVTGERDVTNEVVTLPDVLVDPSSGFTQSDLLYRAYIDGINGKAISVGVSSDTTPFEYAIHGKGIASDNVREWAKQEGACVVVTGWCVVQGGVSKYVWSADGGKTWNDCVYFRERAGDASAAMVAAANGYFPNTFTDADVALGEFQGGHNGFEPSGIAADLTAYIGQRVNIIFGAVPNADTTTICPLAFVVGVTPVANPQ